jgi:trypsin
MMCNTQFIRGSLKHLFVVIVMMASTEALSSDVYKIYGGSEVVEDQFPWVVQIYSDRRGVFCSGTVLDRKWVLTAAHCVDDYDPDMDGRLVVKLGALFLYSSISGQEERNVSEIVLHPNYHISANGAPKNDIALLRLRSATSKESISMSEQLEYPSKNQLKVAGWGKTEQNSMSRIMKYASVDYISSSECEAIYEGFPDSQLCAGDVENGGVDACQGDSGGPLFYMENGQWFQAGIVSYGYGCALVGKPGVYTRVSSYKEWVARVIEMGGAVFVEPDDPNVFDGSQEDVDFERLSAGAVDWSVVMFMFMFLFSYRIRSREI